MFAAIEKKSMSFAMIFILHLFNCSHFALPPEDFLVNLSLQPLGNWIFPSKAITVSSKYLKCQIYQFLVNVYLSKVVVLQNWSCESIQIHNKKQLVRYSFFAKSFFLDICLGSECGSDIFKIAFLFPVVLLVYFLISNKKDTWSRYFKSSSIWREKLQSPSNQISETSLFRVSGVTVN